MLGPAQASGAEGRKSLACTISLSSGPREKPSFLPMCGISDTFLEGAYGVWRWEGLVFEDGDRMAHSAAYPSIPLPAYPQ